jgi:hypothetical protein
MLFRRGREDAFRLGETGSSLNGVSSLDKHNTSQSDGYGSSDQHDDPSTRNGTPSANSDHANSSPEGYDLASWQADPIHHALESRAESLGSLSTDGGSAGNGGHGTFIGAMVDSDVAVYIPLNIAISAYGGTATATQGNAVTFDLHAGQLGGAGGGGGHDNLAGGGSIVAAGHASPGDNATDSGHAGLLSFLPPETLSSFESGGHAGNGGDGIFMGAMLDMDVAIYAPVNIAIGFGGNVTATQYNSVVFDQGAIQIGGIGGQGGSGNSADGGAGLWSLLHGDTVHTGGGDAGNGGDGVFVGVMNDNDLAIYAPVNIAIGGAAINPSGLSGELHHSGDWLSDMVNGSGHGSMDLNHDLAMLIHDLTHLG